MTAEERMEESRASNKFESGILNNIKTHGLQINHVGEGVDPDTPCWSYSIGLWHSHQHPEIVIVGLEHSLTRVLLNNMADDIEKRSVRYENGTSYTNVIDNFRCYLQTLEPENYGDWLRSNEWFYGGKEFPAVQMIWPNTSGIYPWDQQANDYLRWVQPILTKKPLIVS